MIRRIIQLQFPGFTAECFGMMATSQGASRASCNSGWWWIAGVAAVLVAIGSTRLGAWTQSYLGAGVRWQQAHTALETAESNLPRNSRERERLLLATAQADAEPASGLAIGPRLHKAGTLARLHYETFDEKFPP